MIASTILVLISGAILVSLMAGNRSFLFGSDSYVVQQQVHMLIDRMSVDIRQARKIVVAEPDRIEFWDRNGVYAGYFTQNGDIFNLTGRRLNKTGATITLDLTYFKKDGNEPVILFGYVPTIWSVEIDLTASKESQRADYQLAQQSMTLNNLISLRNVKLIR